MADVELEQIQPTLGDQNGDNNKIGLNYKQNHENVVIGPNDGNEHDIR